MASLGVVRMLIAVAALAVTAGCSSVPSASVPSAAAPSASVPSTTAPSATGQSSSSSSRRSTPHSTSVTTSAGALPGDLVPNAVEDECVLATAEFAALIGRSVARADNTELADDNGRRSCFYTDSTDEPLGRTDVYAPAAAPAPELVSRIAANSAGSRTLTGVGDGAVVVSGQDGSYELVVASRALLAVLTVPPGAAATAPTDAAWSAAGTAMVSRLPR